MGDFKKFGKKGDTWNRGTGGRPGFGGDKPQFGRGDRGGDRGDRPMYKAVCAECGKPCEVPFRPSGDRPVYCKDCFAAMGPQDRDPSSNLRAGDRGPSRGPSNFQKRDRAPGQSFTGFAPRPYSPAPQQGSGEDKRLDDLKIQLVTVISKLDKLINLQTNTAHTTPKVVSSAKSETLQETIAKIAPKTKVPSKKKSPAAKKK